MEKMIAPCGLDCAACEAYQATQARDSKALEELAAKWSVQYKTELKVEAVMCDGCLAQSGRTGCYSGMCSVRTCATNRHLSSCGHCREFGCNKISDFFELAPEAKANITAIRVKRGK